MTLAKKGGAINETTSTRALDNLISDAGLESADPSRCRLWQLHDRLSEFVTVENCRDAIQSFRKNGQLQPVLGRPVNGRRFDYELVYGARRRFVAEYLGLPLLVLVTEITDREAILALDAENRTRSDISPVERGLSYRAWLDAGLYPSQRALAAALGVSKSYVSRAISFAAIPGEVLSAFGHPGALKEYWATQLVAAMSTGAARERVISAAKRIGDAEQPIPTKEVFRLLKNASERPASQSPSKQNGPRRILRDSRGRPLFRVRKTRNSVAIEIPNALIDASTLERVTDTLVAILEIEQKDRPKFGTYSTHYAKSRAS